MEKIGWDRVRRLFRKTLKIAPEKRGAFLRRECGDDQVRAEVESLLAHHQGASDSFLTPPVQSQLRVLLEQAQRTRDSNAEEGQ